MHKTFPLKKSRKLEYINQYWKTRDSKGLLGHKKHNFSAKQVIKIVIRFQQNRILKSAPSCLMHEKLAIGIEKV